MRQTRGADVRELHRVVAIALVRQRSFWTRDTANPQLSSKKVGPASGSVIYGGTAQTWVSGLSNLFSGSYVAMPCRLQDD